MMATDCSSRSKDVCQICGQETSYRCFKLPSQSATDQKVVPLLPLSKNLDGSQGTLRRYALRVQIQSLNLASEEQSATPREAILQRQRRNKRALQLPKQKRKCLDISEKVKVLEFAKQNPNLGSRKLADHFGIGKTQVQSIRKTKEAIMDVYASNETPNHAKRKRSSKYSDVNQAVWDWYTMCRNSNIPVSGSTLQEEATLIAET